ncbi:unnamed protein product [Dovyalis caffra]|uniref:Nudix hydrolase domain-containing protein n=1 Tax=Dovyalis caffra TaxID=77055 RepID=A0AAV1QQR7_9ROSI|nr:unnamed protein product [Dovyalis caffra]
MASSPSTSLLPIKEQIVPENEVQQIGLPDADEDQYSGVTVHMKELMDSDVYVALLRVSISQWRQQGKKGIWIKLPIQLADLVVPTIKEGFKYHHAEPDYLMLVHWIPETPNTLPANASHYAGIGAFVMNINREVLVVKEKHGEFEQEDVWKLPTGVVNQFVDSEIFHRQGEDICAGAIREVREETAIHTEFAEILAFQQFHQQLHGKSNLFFVCMLRPLSFKIKKQDSEIEAAQWMPIEEYVNQPYHQKHKSFDYIANICLKKSQNDYSGFSSVPTSTSSSTKPNLYFNGQDFKIILVNLLPGEYTDWNPVHRVILIDVLPSTFRAFVISIFFAFTGAFSSLLTRGQLPRDV